MSSSVASSSVDIDPSSSSSSSLSDTSLPPLTTSDSPPQVITTTPVMSSPTTSESSTSTSSPPTSISTSGGMSSDTTTLPTSIPTTSDGPTPPTTTPQPPTSPPPPPTSEPSVTPPPTVVPPTSQPPTTPPDDPTTITPTPQPTSVPPSDPPDDPPTTVDPTTPPPTIAPDPTQNPNSSTSTPPQTTIQVSDPVSISPGPPSSEPSPTVPDIAPSSTFSSTVFLTTTDSQGSTTLSAPPFITSLSTSTRPDGTITTITQVVANPTLIDNNASSRASGFFRNTGAVAGVFVLVGLAVTSIILWIIFAVRRRRRHQRLDHDTAVSATLAAAGFHRTPLVDDDDDVGANSTPSRYSPAPSNPFMAQRSSSALAMSNRASAAYLVDHDGDHVVPGGTEFNPYAEYALPSATPTRMDGYIPVPAPTAAPIFPSPFRDRSSGSYDVVPGSGSDHGYGHAHRPSTTSIEPLITTQPGAPARSGTIMSLPPAYADNTPPGAEGARALGRAEPSAASSVYSQHTDVGPDARLDPGLRQRLVDHEDDADDGASLFRDEVDYSRPVLGVRNMPDAASEASTRP